MSCLKFEPKQASLLTDYNVALFGLLTDINQESTQKSILYVGLYITLHVYPYLFDAICGIASGSNTDSSGMNSLLQRCVMLLGLLLLHPTKPKGTLHNGRHTGI